MGCTAAASVVVVPSLRSDARGWWGRALSVLGLAAVAHRMALWCHRLPMALAIFYSQLSAMDVSARTTMKGAAKCDKHCELQNSVNRQELERILCFWDIPESMPASVSMLCCSSSCSLKRGMLLRSLVPQDAHSALLRHSIDKALLRQPAY